MVMLKYGHQGLDSNFRRNLETVIWLKKKKRGAHAHALLLGNSLCTLVQCKKPAWFLILYIIFSYVNNTLCFYEGQKCRVLFSLIKKLLQKLNLYIARHHCKYYWSDQRNGEAALLQSKKVLGSSHLHVRLLKGSKLSVVVNTCVIDYLYVPCDWLAVSQPKSVLTDPSSPASWMRTRDIEYV